MPVIEKQIEIAADPEAVFDLITRVEEFPPYVSLLKEVKPTGPDTYIWSVVVAGIKLSWEGVVTERKRPSRFAWKSVSGQPNAGAYDLRPVEMGTEVRFTMEYRFQNPFLEFLLTPLLEPLMHKAAAEAMAYIRMRLEQGLTRPIHELP